MTPADIKALEFALRNVNSPRPEKRVEAKWAFNRLNRTYGRDGVDRARKEMESAPQEAKGSK